MAHYAFINDNNTVTEVIVGINEDNTETLPEGFADWEEWYGDFRGQTCKRTSYNTSANAHSGDGTPFRGNYAGKGYTYDSDNDVFIPPKPFGSWILNESTWSWDSPLDYPDDGQEYIWNENAYAQENNDPYIIDSIGWAYYLVGDFIKAEKFLKRAVELMPDDPVVNDHYGDILWKLDRKIQARYFWSMVLVMKDAEQKLINKIQNKLIDGLKSS